ncbi:Mediator of RNA polymerase II transcription subunit 23 [Linum perenne]
MDQSQRSLASTTTASRGYQFHPARAAILDLFNLYLGDQDQLRAVTESVLVSLVVQCSNHAPRAEFLLFASRILSSIGYINWDSFLPGLLSSVSSAELTVGQSGSSDISGNGQPSTARVGSSSRDNALSSLRQHCCKIILIGLGFNLKPVTHIDIFCHMLNWLVNWDQKHQSSDESDGRKSWRPDKALVEWLHSCLDVVWLLVDEDKCRVPFYELLRSGVQFIENIPDDEALFTLILEIHRRRDMMAMHMQMLDQHLHCPTFGTHRFLSQATTNLSVEVVANLRYSPITYPSVLGEPLHGEVDLANSIQKGSLDWERALRCIRHALRATPSPDWWKRVLLVASCYRNPAHGPTPGAVFTSSMIYSDQKFLRTNHVTWLLAQVIKVELVMNALKTDARKVETIRKIISFHREDRCSDPNNPQNILLDFISSCQNLRIWSLNTSTREYLNNEQLQKGKQIDEWWTQMGKGDRMMDYMNMDDRSIGMFWVFSFTMAQPACEAVVNWLSSAGVSELLPGTNIQSNERVMVMREVSPLPMPLLSGLSMNLCLKLVFQLEDSLFAGQHLAQRYPALWSKPGVTLLVLEIVNYRLLPLYSMLEQIMATSQHTWSEKTLYHFPPLLRDALIGRMDKRGLGIQAWQQAETTVINQCTQLLSPSADPTYVMTYINHSFPQHRQYLCAGAWILMQEHPESINSGHLARVLREFSPEEVTANIYTMVDVLLHHINVELQHGHSLQVHFRLIFADVLMKICANLAYFVWTNELLPLDILLLALIDRDDDPHALRIVISLLDRQELQQRVKLFCLNRGPPEHWLHSGIFKRLELHKALGNHLSWKDRNPTFFDDVASRLLPVIPLIVYRLIENDAIDPADRVLAMYSPFLAYHSFRFTFVRDILAYFYGHLPGKLIVRILNVLDLSKIPFSESFPQHISSSNPVMCPPPEYFATLLLGLVNNVIPPLHVNWKYGSIGECLNISGRTSHSKTPGTSQSSPTNSLEGQKAFYQIQDPGTHTQLVLETAVIELLSLPVSTSQIVSSLVQVVVNIQPTLIQSSNGFYGTSNNVGQGSGLPTSPSGGSTDSLGASRSAPSVPGINASNFVSRSGYTCQQLSCLMIQACGMLLAQLPPDFHTQLYVEASRIVKETWWLSDDKRSLGELDSAVGYALLDPTWAAQDNTSTAIGEQNFPVLTINPFLDFVRLYDRFHSILVRRVYRLQFFVFFFD